MSTRSSYRVCLFCEKSGNNCQRVIHVQNEAQLARLNLLFNKNYTNNVEACLNFYEKVRYTPRFNQCEAMNKVTQTNSSTGIY